MAKRSLGTKSLPECMAPDGGEACAAYAELHAKHIELTEVVQRVARAFADTPLGAAARKALLSSSEGGVKR